MKKLLIVFCVLALPLCLGGCVNNQQADQQLNQMVEMLDIFGYLASCQKIVFDGVETQENFDNCEQTRIFVNWAYQTEFLPQHRAAGVEIVLLADLVDEYVTEIIDNENRDDEVLWGLEDEILSQYDEVDKQMELLLEE